MLLELAVNLAAENYVQMFKFADYRHQVVSIAGFLVNMVGIMAFSHAHTHGGAPCPSSKDKGYRLPVSFVKQNLTNRKIL